MTNLEQQEIKSYNQLSECELRQKRDDMIEFDKGLLSVDGDYRYPNHQRLIFAIEGILKARIGI